MTVGIRPRTRMDLLATEAVMIEIGHGAAGAEEIAVGVVIVRGTDLVVNVGQGGHVAQTVGVVELAGPAAGVGEQATDSPSSLPSTREVFAPGIADLRGVRAVPLLDDEHAVVDVMRFLGVGPRGGCSLEADGAIRSRAGVQGESAGIVCPHGTIGGHAGCGTDWNVVIVPRVTTGRLLAYDVVGRAGFQGDRHG